jgi:hypothetical protein
MRNVVPEGALERRSRSLLLAGFVVLLFGALIAVAGMAMFVIALVVPSNPSYDLYDTTRKGVVVLGVIVMLIGFLMVGRALTWKRDNPVAEIAGNWLTDHLDDRYVFIRNVSKVALGYIDAVLIGPPGVLVCRITDKTGVLFNEGGRWLRQRDKGQWGTMRWNPTQEAVDDVKRLREWLKTRGIPDAPVFGAVVFVQEAPSAQVTAKSPIVPAIYLSEMTDEIRNPYFAKQDRLAQPVVNQIATLLYGG